MSKELTYVRRLRWARETLFPGLTAEDVSRAFRSHQEHKKKRGCATTTLYYLERDGKAEKSTARNGLVELCDYYAHIAAKQRRPAEQFTYEALCPNDFGEAE